MTTDHLLGTEKIPKLVCKIAFPSMIAQLVSVLYSIVDRIFVGNIDQIGDISLAGVGICGPIITMIGAGAFWIGIGGTPLMGIALGEQKKKKAEAILANCFLMLLLMAALVTCTVIPLREPMLRLFGCSDVTYPYAEAYFKIYISGTVFAFLSTGLNQFIIGQGYAKIGMCSVMLGAFINIVLDPIFIFVFHLGVKGAALATVISQAVNSIFVLYFLFKKSSVRLSFGNYRLTIMFKVFKLGMSPFFIIAADNVMIITMNTLLQKYGGANGDALITCNTVVQSFMLLLTMPLGGISGGTQGIISYNYGAGNSKRVLKAQKYIILLCTSYTLLMYLLAQFEGALFASLFTQNEELIAEAQRAIKICVLFAVPLGIQYAIVDGFTAMNEVKYSFPLSAFRKFTFFASILWIPHFFKADMIFYAEPISDLLGPLISVPVYLFQVKKILKKRELRLSKIQNH